MRIGIDVGGTHTDAVLIDGSRVVAETKATTSANITEGIATVIDELVRQASVPRSSISAVMVGTTHFINAFIQARDLATVAALRLGLPASEDIPPMSGWPEPLLQALGGTVFQCHGGHEADGREISALRPEEIEAAARRIRDSAIESVAVSAIFSPINPAAETAAAEILARMLPDVPITMSHQVGGIDLLMRENAAIINASLRPLASRVIVGLIEAVRDSGIDAPLFLTQNDGTVLDAESVIEFPVTTFASGPTNSMRGAGLLTDLDSCVVVDIGGTTSDVGSLQNGYPRERLDGFHLGGVMTNFRMPDVVSIGLGGGSIVREEDGSVVVGPQSVGAELTRKALVFGGDVLTATDIAVAGGRAEVGDPSKVAHLDPGFVAAALNRIDEMIIEVVDLARLSAEPVSVVVVGGGAILLGTELEGYGPIQRPEHFSVANAIGAANAQVSGQTDHILNLEPSRRAELIAQAEQEAITLAADKGAESATIRVVDVEQIPLAYLPGHSTRVRVRAVGDLKLESVYVDR